MPNRIVKGSIVRCGYDPRVIGEVVGFKVVKGKRYPIVNYGGEQVLDTSSLELASRKKKHLVFRLKEKE